MLVLPDLSQVFVSMLRQHGRLIFKQGSLPGGRHDGT